MRQLLLMVAMTLGLETWGGGHLNVQENPEMSLSSEDIALYCRATGVVWQIKRGSFVQDLKFSAGQL